MMIASPHESDLAQISRLVWLAVNDAIMDSLVTDSVTHFGGGVAFFLLAVAERVKIPVSCEDF